MLVPVLTKYVCPCVGGKETLMYLQDNSIGGGQVWCTLCNKTSGYSSNITLAIGKFVDKYLSEYKEEIFSSIDENFPLSTNIKIGG